MSPSKRQLLTLLLAFSALPHIAQAHHVWIEPTKGGQMVLRFGEFAENLRETSPGLLDGFGQPTATLLGVSTEKPLAVAKTSDAFTFPRSLGEKESLISEDGTYRLRKFKQADKELVNWFHPAARYAGSFDAVEPQLDLDVVPAGKPGDFKVFFKGSPLPKANATLQVPAGWEMNALTDEQGRVHFDLPWKGIYVLEVNRNVREPGERNGEHYDSISYVTSLTVIAKKGASSLHPRPVSQPSK